MKEIFCRVIKSERTKEFIRFCIVGVVATIIHYSIYLLVIKLFKVEDEIFVNVAYSLGYILSWCCNLWLTAHFTFKKDLSLKRGLGFAVSHVVNYMLHIIFLNVFIFIGVTNDIAPIPVYCVVIPINFVLVRLVFNKI